LAAAFLLELAQFSILWLLQGAVQNMGVVVVLAVFGVVRIGLSTLTGLVLISALLSWVQTRSSMAEWLDRLVAPWLAPVRRVLPLFGGIDLSPLALLLALQIVALLLNALQGFAVMAVAV
jgi:YggT family protein